MKKNKILSLSIIAVSLSNFAYADVINANIGNKTGINNSENSIALGSGSISLNDYGISHGHNAIATSGNISKEEFEKLNNERNIIINQKNTLENNIKENKNNINNSLRNLTQSNNELLDINNEIDKYGNNIEKINDARQQIKIEEDKKEQLSNRLNELNDLFNKKGEFLTFFNVLQKLNWQELGKENGYVLMGNQLKEVVNKEYPNIAQKYNDEKYINIIKGYINVETLLDKNIKEINEKFGATNFLSRGENGVNGIDFLSDGRALENIYISDFREEDENYRMFKVYNNDKPNISLINKIDNMIENIKIDANNDITNNITKGSYYYMKKNKEDNPYFKYVNIIHSNHYTHPSSAELFIDTYSGIYYNPDTIKLFINSNEKIIDLNVFIAEVINSDRNALLTQSSSNYRRQLNNVNLAISTYENIDFNNNQNSMIKDLNDAKTKLEPYYLMLKKNKEILELYFEIEKMPEGNDRIVKQSQFLSALEDYNNGETKNKIEDLKRNNPLLKDNPNKIKISDGLKNLMIDSLEEYKNLIVNSKDKLLGYNPNDDMIKELQQETEKIQNEIQEKNAEIKNIDQNIKRLTDTINGIEIGKTEEELNRLKEEKEREIIQLTENKKELEQELENNNNNLENINNKIKELTTPVDNDSIAFGKNAFSSGESSIVFGNNSSSMANHTAIYGNNNVISEAGIRSNVFGSNNTIKSIDNIVLGNGNTIEKGHGNIILGSKITIDNEDFNDNVVIGNESTLSKFENIKNMTINNTIYSIAGNKANSVVSVGSSLIKRPIINVGAGSVHEDSTDAINGSQLNAVIKEINNIAENANNINVDVWRTKLNINSPQTVIENKVDLTHYIKYDENQTSGNKITLRENTTINNVKDGEIAENSKEAINGGQIYSIINDINNKAVSSSEKINMIDNQINNRINALDDKFENAVASSNAMAGMVQATKDGSSLVGISIGGYGNKQAIAIGVSGVTENGKIVYKVNGAINVQGKQKLNYSTSIGYQF